jgi:hypothetical protein
VTATAPPAEITAMSNTGDKGRSDELVARSSAYSSKTPVDGQERVAIGTIVSQLTDENTSISGGRRFDGNGSGGLQQPRKAG